MKNTHTFESYCFQACNCVRLCIYSTKCDLMCTFSFYQNIKPIRHVKMASSKAISINVWHQPQILRIFLISHSKDQKMTNLIYSTGSNNKINSCCFSVKSLLGKNPSATRIHNCVGEIGLTHNLTI